MILIITPFDMIMVMFVFDHDALINDSVISRGFFERRHPEVATLVVIFTE